MNEIIERVAKQRMKLDAAGKLRQFGLAQSICLLLSWQSHARFRASHPEFPGSATEPLIEGKQIAEMVLLKERDIIRPEQVLAIHGLWHWFDSHLAEWHAHSGAR